MHDDTDEPTELGACPACHLAADGWRLCPQHRPDDGPKSLAIVHHLADARAELRRARAQHPAAQ